MIRLSSYCGNQGSPNCETQLYRARDFERAVKMIHASVWAILATVAVFAILNLIDFRRID